MLKRIIHIKRENLEYKYTGVGLIVRLVSFYSGFSQTHKIGNICIIANFVYPSMYLQFPALFAPYDVGKKQN